MNTKLKKVMLVDDDDITNNLNTRLIEKLGISDNVVIATNGQKAIEYLNNCNETNQPDLIILDINMPVMNGFEFLETFHNTFAHKPKPLILMMLTTSVQNSDFAKAKTFDEVSEYISKPLTPVKIKDIMVNYFGWK